MKKILISTGGSGGHVIPALNLFDHLKNLHNILLVTDERGKKFICLLYTSDAADE